MDQLCLCKCLLRAGSTLQSQLSALRGSMPGHPHLLAKGLVL